MIQSAWNKHQMNLWVNARNFLITYVMLNMHRFCVILHVNSKTALWPWYETCWTSFYKLRLAWKAWKDQAIPEANFDCPFLWNASWHCNKISPIVSFYWGAVQNEIFRSKVKGQGHKGCSKFNFWHSITPLFSEIEPWNSHQNVQNYNLYEKKIFWDHVVR